MKTKKQYEMGIMTSSSGENPFWIRSNEYGAIPFESHNVTLRASVHKEYDSLYRISGKLNKVSYGYGVSLIGVGGKVNQFMIQEAYMKGRWRAFEMYAGRRKEIYGLMDSTLSSGSYIWSGNAQPMPKIEISIPNYVSILGKGIIAIKGHFSHAWFGTQNFTKDYYLHQKTFYGRIGRPNWKLNLYGGINNEIQWGGYSEILKNDPHVTQNGYMASGFNAFLGNAFPFQFIRRNFPTKIKLDNDLMNYGGNVLGSVDLAMELKSKNINFLLYRQVPYELGTLFTSLTNADDGLYGLALKFKEPQFSIQKIVLEGFHSYNQGRYRSRIAKIFNLKDQHYGEVQDYLNHGQYLDGWQYNNNSIGTPLIPPNNNLKSGVKFENYDRFTGFNNLKMIYLAINGSIRNTLYVLKGNYGIYKYDVLLFKQTSLSLNLDFKLKEQSQLITKIALDQGQTFKNSGGLYIGYRKTWY